MSLSLIAAVAENNCIGVDGKLPWHIPEDLKFFQKNTLGKPVLMGRKTWESIPERFRPLKERTNIVLTRQSDYPLPEGVFRIDSLESLTERSATEEVMVIGGAELYRQALPLANKLYITHVHRTVEGDAFFPTIDPSVWQEETREDHPDFSFVTYIRK
jgi:dihydrofolate reductase